MAELVQVPVLVGVTGHRDPLPEASISVNTAVEHVLRELHGCTGGALHVVTGLAEGADQLVADVAETLQIPLIAIAPMPFDEYLNTIESASAQGRFRRHWDRAMLRIELPWVDQEGRSHELQYEQFGLVLSRQSHVLLALWNGLDEHAEARCRGEPNAGRGGSAHVVGMRRKGERSEASAELFRYSQLFYSRPGLLELSRSGPIIHVVTPRQQNSDAVCLNAHGQRCHSGTIRWWSASTEISVEPLGNGLEWTILTSPSDIADKLPAEILDIQSLNADLNSLPERLIQHVQQHKEHLCPEADLSGMQNLEAYGPLAWLRELQAHVDVSATQYQRWLIGEWSPGLSLRGAFKRGWAQHRLPTPGALLGFATAVPMATLAFEVYAHIWRAWPAILIYLIIVGAALAAYWGVVRRHRWQAKFQDRRALAEALRVQFFWALAGVPVSVSDNYLGYQKDELGWIRQAVRGPALWAVAAGVVARETPGNLVLRHWIEDQRSWFEGAGSPKFGKAGENSAAARAMEFWATVMLVGPILLATGVLIAHLLGYLPQGDEPVRLSDLLIVLMGWLPAWAAFFVINLEVRAYQEHAHAYSRAGHVFALAKQKALMLPSSDRDRWRELVLALGREALEENASWLENHRERPVSYKAGA